MIQKIWLILGGRKFIAWAVASFFVGFKVITHTEWFWLTVAYFGINFLKAFLEHMFPIVLKKE